MMENCKAAIYNPANACTDRCKWPGACVNGKLSIASVMETTQNFLEQEADAQDVAVEDVQEATATPAEPAKRKGGRPRKVQ